MGLLEKSKVTLTLLCEVSTCAPNSVITGTLRIEVHEKVSFTALRLRFKGKEDFYERHQTANGGSYYIRRDFTHVEERCTFLGAPEGSSSSNSMQLEPCTHDYPFSVCVPEGAPPSFTRSKTNYGCTVAYTLKGFLEISHGFNAEVESEITVTQAVSVAQLQSSRQSLLTLPLSTANVARCSCCGWCFCCVDKASWLQTEAVLAPSIVLLHAQEEFPASTALLGTEEEQAGPTHRDLARPIELPGNAAVAVLRARVINATRKCTPDRCLVTLWQRDHFKQNFDSPAEEKYKIVSVEALFPGGPLPYGKATMVEVPLRLDAISEEFPKKHQVLPCLAVKHFAITTELTITFPGVVAEDTMCVTNALLLANDVGMPSQCVQMPYHYQEALLVDGDAALVS